MSDSDPVLFALNATRELGLRVAGGLGIELSAHEERDFEDGEHKARPLVSVRRRCASTAWRNRYALAFVHQPASQHKG